MSSRHATCCVAYTVRTGHGGKACALDRPCAWLTQSVEMLGRLNATARGLHTNLEEGVADLLTRYRPRAWRFLEADGRPGQGEHQRCLWHNLVFRPALVASALTQHALAHALFSQGVCRGSRDHGGRMGSCERVVLGGAGAHLLHRSRTPRTYRLFSTSFTHPSGRRGSSEGRVASAATARRGLPLGFANDLPSSQHVQDICMAIAAWYRTCLARAPPPRYE